MPTTLRLLFLLMLGLFGLQPVSYAYDAPVTFASGAQNIVAASPESQAATAESAASVPLNFSREGRALDRQADTRTFSNFVAAESDAAESAPLNKAAPDFVVSPGGTAFPVPEGATGPVPTNAPGFQYNGGLGGNGLAPGVTDVRFMEPNLQNPGGYVNYGARQANGGWQSVNPYTGQAISSSDPWWHIPANPP